MVARLIGLSAGIVGLALAPGYVGAQQASFVRVYSPSTPGLFPSAVIGQHQNAKIPDARGRPNSTVSSAWTSQ